MATPQQASSPVCSTHSKLECPNLCQKETTELSTHLLGRDETDEGLQATASTNSNKLADELADTARCLLQHALVTIVFALKLCAIPLVYLVQSLADPRDLRWLAGIAFPSSSTLYDCARVQSGGEIAFSETSTYVADMITLPFRLTRDLWRICNFPQRSPEVYSRAGSRSRLTADNAETINVRDYNRRVLSEASTHSIAWVPMPTEVYHAALSDGGDLDEVLAAFDLNDSKRGSLVDGEGLVQDGSSIVELRSLQCTPPEMYQSMEHSRARHALQTAQPRSSGFACFDSVFRKNQDNYTPPSAERIAYPPKTWARSATLNDQRHMSLPEEYIVHSIKELLGDTNVLESCPSHVRQHRRSLLPRRLGSRSAVSLGSHATGGPQEALTIGKNPTSKKGAKLRKRRPVQTVTNESSMTSLPWRF